MSQDSQSTGPPEPRPYLHRLRVRYAETDQMGVVHHSNYALYLEEARTGMLDQLGCSYAEMERSGLGLVVRRLEVRYRAPARYADLLLIQTRLSKVGGASLRFEYTILKELEPGGQPECLAEAATELACVDLRRKERGPCLLPERLRALLSGLV